MEKKLKNLIKVLLLFADFKDSELEQIVDCFKQKEVRKSSIILSSGQICQEFYFVYSGCIRTFFIDFKGNEKSRYILFENHIGTSLSSFINQKPSFEFIDALEDSELLSIDFNHFYMLNNHIPNWKIFYQKILEMAYSFQNKKIENLVTLSAKQRYDFVINENPQFLQRLSNKILASYLDIREETLSRLKSK